MEEKINFSLVFGSWKSLKSKEQLRIKAYDTGGLDLPMGTIEQVYNENGEEVNNKIIASTNDTYVMGNRMNLHPFMVRILATNRILLIHKETGVSKIYNRLN